MEDTRGKVGAQPVSGRALARLARASVLLNKSNALTRQQGQTPTKPEPVVEEERLAAVKGTDAVAFPRERQNLRLRKATDVSVKCTSQQRFPGNLLRWERLPAATWLVEIWRLVTNILEELRVHLHPPRPQLFPLAAAALEACCRVATPLRPSLHQVLQELHLHLAACSGCMGLKSWTSPLAAVAPKNSSAEHGAATGAAALHGAVDAPDASQEACAGADLRSSVMLSSNTTSMRVAAIALDAHGRSLLVVSESQIGSTQWNIEFWRKDSSNIGLWERVSGARAHTSVIPPVCTLTGSAVMGITAGECLCAWDSDDAQQLFSLSWSHAGCALGVWCSNDGARMAVATSTAIYYWHDQELLNSLDYRAIVVLADQGQSRAAAREGQSALGHRHITAAHCAFGVDGSVLLAGVVDNRWVGVLHLMPIAYGTKSTAYALAHPLKEVLSLWIGADGVLLMLLPEKLEIWTLPIGPDKKPKAKRTKTSASEMLTHACNLQRLAPLNASQQQGRGSPRLSLISAVTKSVEEPANPGQPIDAVGEEAFESLEGGPPDTVVCLATQKRWRRACLSLLPVRRILTFNEYSRLLLCWDAEASAAVAFVLPIWGVSRWDNVSKMGCGRAVLEPQWATALPGLGSLRITASTSAHGDLVLLGAGMTWSLWSFQINICNVINIFAISGADNGVGSGERVKPKRRNLQEALLEAGGSVPKEPEKTGRRNPKRGNILFMDLGLIKEIAESHIRKTEWKGAGPASLLPAATGSCLRPAPWWSAHVKHTLAEAKVRAKPKSLFKTAGGVIRVGATVPTKDANLQNGITSAIEPTSEEEADAPASSDSGLGDDTCSSSSSSSDTASPTASPKASPREPQLAIPPWYCTRSEKVRPAQPLENELPCTIAVGLANTGRRQTSPEPNRPRSVFGRLGLSPVPAAGAPPFPCRSDSRMSGSSRSHSPSRSPSPSPEKLARPQPPIGVHPHPHRRQHFAASAHMRNFIAGGKLLVHPQSIAGASGSSAACSVDSEQDAWRTPSPWSTPDKSGRAQSPWSTSTLGGSEVAQIQRFRPRSSSADPDLSAFPPTWCTYSRTRIDPAGATIRYWPRAAKNSAQGVAPSVTKNLCSVVSGVELIPPSA